MILSDRTLRALCEPPYHYEHVVETREYKSGVKSETIDSTRSIYGRGEPMISPFVPNQVREVDNRKIVSYGLASYGYDVRLADEFKIFTNVRNAIIDPLNPDPDCFVEHKGDYCIIPPNSYILGHTIETFRIPRDVMVVCVGKSTYARLAAIVNVTPIEPEFEGSVVIEIANGSPLPLKVYANQGIGQFLFFKGDRPCEVSYADKGGKYQGQTGLTLARL